VPFQSAPFCAEAVINATISGVPLANVLNFRRLSGYDQAHIDDLATAIDIAVGADYLPILASAVSYSHVLVRGLESVIDLTSSASASAGSGAVGGATMPNNVSLVATLRTGFTGRSARGRFYAMPMSSSSLASQNTLDGAIGSGLESFLEACVVAGASTGWEMIVLSRYTLGAKRSVAIGTPVTDIEIRNLLVDSQRRRLAGRGS